jgi:hypothetical protein
MKEYEHLLCLFFQKSNTLPMRAFFLCLLSLLLFASIGFSQNKEDVIYLKDGSILKGKVVGKDKDKKVKFKTSDGKVTTYTDEEIEDMDADEEIDVKVKTGSADKRGYVGLSVGVNMPMGQFASKSGTDVKNIPGYAKTGVQLNLINFGYRFTDHIGICGSILAAKNDIDIADIDPWGYGAIMVGPLFTFPIDNRIDWDLRPMLGYSIVNLSDHGVDNGNEQTSSLGLSLGTMFRFHITKSVSLTVNGDYFYTKAKFSKAGFDAKITTLSIGGGVAFRLN